MRKSMTRTLLHEREVWDAAMFLVTRHGVEAPELARTRAGQLETRDAVSARIWGFIAEAAAEIVRANPGEGDRVH
jgi:hypothetical protein